MRKLFVVIIMLFLFLSMISIMIPSNVSATSTNINSTHTSCLRYNDATNYADQIYFMGVVPNSPNLFRAVISFDISTIPEGMNIDSATIYVYQHSNTNAYSNTIHARRITSSWTYNTVDWLDQPTVTATDEGSISWSTSASTWFSCDVTNIVDSWYSGASTNYGIELIAHDEGNYGGSTDVHGQDQTEKPYLAITYSSSGWYPAFTSTPITFNGMGNNYQYQITTNETCTITVLNKPSWMTISHNGSSTSPWYLNGSASATGNYPINIKAVNSVDFITYQNFTLEVVPYPLGSWENEYDVLGTGEKYIFPEGDSSWNRVFLVDSANGHLNYRNLSVSGGTVTLGNLYNFDPDTVYPYAWYGDVKVYQVNSSGYVVVGLQRPVADHHPTIQMFWWNPSTSNFISTFFNQTINYASTDVMESCLVGLDDEKVTIWLQWEAVDGVYGTFWYYQPTSGNLTQFTGMLPDYKLTSSHYSYYPFLGAERGISVHYAMLNESSDELEIYHVYSDYHLTLANKQDKTLQDLRDLRNLTAVYKEQVTVNNPIISTADNPSIKVLFGNTKYYPYDYQLNGIIYLDVGQVAKIWIKPYESLYAYIYSDDGMGLVLGYESASSNEEIYITNCTQLQTANGNGHQGTFAYLGKMAGYPYYEFSDTSGGNTTVLNDTYNPNIDCWKTKMSVLNDDGYPIYTSGLYNGSDFNYAMPFDNLGTYTVHETYVNVYPQVIYAVTGDNLEVYYFTLDEYENGSEPIPDFDDWLVIQEITVDNVYTATDIYSISFLGLIWLLVTFLPAIIINQFVPRIGFVAGLLIMTVVLGLTMENYFFITIIALIGCAFLVLRGD